MEQDITQNIVIYDYLSFTSKRFTPEEMMSGLGLSHVPWVESRGARGYKSRIFFSSINIFYDGRDDMGVWCEMSGQGCRTFETLTDLKADGDPWSKLLQWIQASDCNITRLDVAYDDHIGVLPLAEIKDDTEAGMFISKSREWQVVNGSKGMSVYHGSAKSKVIVRIYDKAAERHIADQHWVRCELQLRDGRAREFVKLDGSIGENFLGVLLNYLRYVQPSEDSNKWRWSLAGYWASFRTGCQSYQYLSGAGDGIQRGAA